VRATQERLDRLWRFPSPMPTSAPFRSARQPLSASRRPSVFPGTLLIWQLLKAPASGSARPPSPLSIQLPLPYQAQFRSLERWA